MSDVDMIEQIARRLCEADGYDPDITGATGNPRWWLYTTTAGHVVPLIAEAWEEGYAKSERAWAHAYDWHPSPEGGVCPECSTENPYLEEQDV